jgi:hypothetical protein
MYPYAFQEGDFFVNASLSMVHRNSNEYPNSFRRGSFPAISLTGEYAVTKYIGVGPYLALYPRSFKYESSKQTYIFHANRYFTGVSLGLHLSPAIEDVVSEHLDSEHLDIYIMLSGGVKSTLFYGGTPLEDTQKVAGAAMAGMRYFFRDHYGLFLEAGYGPFELAKVGVTTRF